jgi:nucleoside phosphorylase
LVTFALGAEFAPWRKLGGFEAEKWDDIPVHRKRRDGIEWIVVLTGAGPENAGRIAAQALEREAFDLGISAGLIGALRGEDRPGTVLVARRVRRLKDGREIEPAREWIERAVEQGAREAVFGTSSRVVVTAAEKRNLAAKADAIEMETFAVLEAAGTRGVAAAAIRSVSDAAETELPVDFNRTFDAKGRLSSRKLAAEVARRPAALGGLLRLGRESRRAAGILAEFLERYVRAAR